MSVQVIRTIISLRKQVAQWRAEGLSIGLVPTMGALHEGHLTLVKEAQKQCDKVIVTLFVNPKQFGPTEDFDSYPRTEDSDAAKLATVQADALFAPNAAEMYGLDGGQTIVTLTGLGQILEGAHRPGFFDGVATIVTKLLLQALPDRAFFGEKDFQQLAVIKRFVFDLNIPVVIQGVPTVREDDGLALSSRNAYLTAEERSIAPNLNRLLQGVLDQMHTGHDPLSACEAATRDLLAVGFQSVDYITVRDSDDLTKEATSTSQSVRVLGAAVLGKARLIDNVG